MAIINFDINDALKHYMSDPSSIPTPEAESSLLECENFPESLTNSLIDSVLNPIVDSVVGSPDAITRSSSFDSLQFLLKFSSVLPTRALSIIFDLIVSGLSTEAEIIYNDLQNDEQGLIAHHKQLLEIYGFLLQWAVSAVETKAAERTATAPGVRARGKAATKTKAGLKDNGSNWDSATQLQTALETVHKTLTLKLSKIFLTTSERDTFIGLLTRPVYMVLESEQRVKSTAIRMHAFKVLCIAVKYHGHEYAAQISIVQNLTYFEHLAEPMAEFLYTLSEQYDFPQLSDEVLRELSNKEFNSNDTKGPKSVSTFIVRLSELSPRLVNKQMTLLAKHLDSESYTLRCALIEVCGNLITDLSRQGERSESYKSQMNAFFDVLEERFLDLNPYCRCRAIQVFIKLCDLEQKFPKRRQIAAELAVRSLNDKSSHVRRNAIKLLRSLIKTHPFSIMHGSQLSLKEWTTRLEAVEAEIDALKSKMNIPGLERDVVDTQLLDEATIIDSNSPQKALSDEEKIAVIEKSKEEAAITETLQRLTLTQRYYTEALKFIEVLHGATPTICQLLGSKNKSEIIEAMDYFEIGDAYNIEQNKLGIRRMLRLIWTKGNSDEGKAVQNHLIECYKRLFFEAPDFYNTNDAANYIARNMISLTFGATPAELTCLEQLLSTMMKSNLISELVVKKLWQVYGVQKRDISKSQRRGSIIVLGMLAIAKPEIVIGETGTLLQIGLGSLGRSDFLLAKYTCVALSRINPTGRQAKDTQFNLSKFPIDHIILSKLADIIEIETDNKEWHGVAEQAIGAIYVLAKHPDTLCSGILRRKIRSVFQSRKEKSAGAEPLMEIDGDHPITSPSTSLPESKPEKNTIDRIKGSTALSQLLFIVGHIAIKQIVHLELCELNFKRRKAELEKNRASDTSKSKSVHESDDLDMIGGTTEDDITEAIAHIRERELLYGEKSLLANFGPLVSEICSNNTTYPNRNLQASATLCMAKLMCISSEYCETNLPLLITILERSKDPIIRSNVVVALGDIAVCFNHLIDENTDFLYRRLNDKDASVKRTCLMTLTFLILAGQVKVKGQLGEMAKCLEDEDKRIADMSRMFFTELSTKDNAVYNHFIDMFSLLSTEKGLEENAMRRIIKFLAGFIEKDKHAKQLADKLATRLSRCETERQWNDVAYALSLLQHKSEEITKVVAEGFQSIRVNA